MKKMLIFTETKVGEGHFQAAKAIERVIHDHYADQLSIKIFSGMQCVHPLFEFSMVRLYFMLIRYMPFVWKWVYTKNRKSTLFQKYVFAYRIARIIKREDPDYILCTHASCVPALNELKRSGKFRFKLHVVFTDYGFHPYFVQPGVDTYFVAHHKIKIRLVQEFNILPCSVFDYGIPLRPEFEKEDLSGENVILFKDKRKFQLLILGGATGFGPLEKMIGFFHPIIAAYPIQITVITGKNEKLYKRLSRLQLSHVQVLGYVEDMRYWLKRADLVVTKPGGLTVTEALACGTPLLLFQPIPGHEEANLKFLVEEELAIGVQQLEQIPQMIKNKFLRAEQGERWRKNMQQQYKKQAALRIVERISALPLDVQAQKEYN